MKWYHYGLVFILIFSAFFLIEASEELKLVESEINQKTNYDCLVAAVHAAAQTAFIEEELQNSELQCSDEALSEVSDVFFQTLSVLHSCATDEAGRRQQETLCPVLAVLLQDCFYLYSIDENGHYSWRYYESGENNTSEYLVTQMMESLQEYLKKRKVSEKRYNGQSAAEGVWNNELLENTILAFYVPELILGAGNNQLPNVLYAAANCTQEEYWVTQNLTYHLPSCIECNEEEKIASFSTKKEAAEAGACACRRCLGW